MPPKKPSTRKTDDAPAKPAAKRTARSKVAGKAAVAIRPLALLDRAAKGEFPGTVYIEGPDEAVKAAWLAEWRRLWAAAVPDAPLARVLNADEAGVDAILAAYQNVSLFAPRELTLVLELEKLGRSEKRVEALASGLSSPAGASCLVLVEPAAESPRKTLEPVRAACLVRVDVQPPSEQELLEWGRRRLAASGNTPEPGALEALLDDCERDSIAFLNESGKLGVLAGENGRVTVAHVKTLTAPRVGADLPDYLTAVASGDAPKAAQQLERLLAAGENEGSVLWALGHLVTSALTLSTSPYGWARWKPLSQALGRRRNAHSLARAIDAVYRAESAWKGGRTDARSALEQATREVAAR